MQDVSNGSDCLIEDCIIKYKLIKIHGITRERRIENGKESGIGNNDDTASDRHVGLSVLCGSCWGWWSGIILGSSSSNIIFGNDLVANMYGIFFLDGSLSNLIYHNNFLSNTRQVYDFSWDPPPVPPSTNTWDQGYPSGGNYWSDYSGVDKKSGANQGRHGSYGIGDTPYVIDKKTG